jgi:hypothetical protein
VLRGEQVGSGTTRREHRLEVWTSRGDDKNRQPFCSGQRGPGWHSACGPSNP